MNSLKNLGLFLLLFLGLFQGVAYLRDSPLILIARSTASSPLSLAFYKSNGVEFWALDHSISYKTTSEESSTKKLSSGDINLLPYSYFIKMIYAYPFAFSHELPEKLWRSALDKGICKDEKIKNILQIKGNLTELTIQIDSLNKEVTFSKTINHRCSNE